MFRGNVSCTITPISEFYGQDIYGQRTYGGQAQDGFLPPLISGALPESPGASTWDDTDIWGDNLAWEGDVFSFTTKCLELKDRTMRQRTTVRVDSGGTRGNAYEVAGESYFGVAGKIKVKENYKITVRGEDYRVINIDYQGGRKPNCIVYKILTCTPWRSA